MASSSSYVAQTPRASTARYGGLTEQEERLISSTMASARTATEQRRPRAAARDPVPSTSSLAAHADRETRDPPSNSTSSVLSSNSSTIRPQNKTRYLEPTPLARASSATATERDTTRVRRLSSAAGRRPAPPVAVEEPLDPRIREREPLGGLSLLLQESLIVEDLLYVLKGTAGQYVEFHPDYSPGDPEHRLEAAKFTIDPVLDLSLASLVERILPVATFYTAVEAFVEQYSTNAHGVVNQALGAALQEMLHEYRVLVLQLETECQTSSSFTLQRMWFYLHPTLHTLLILHDLTRELHQLSAPPPHVEDDSATSSDESDEDGIGAEPGLRAAMREMRGKGKAVHARGIAKGGETLSVISERMARMSGDAIALSLYSTLLLKASQPYASMLLGWITTGLLQDPCEEFIVSVSQTITRGSLEKDYTDEYWDKRYTLRDAGKRGAAGGNGGHRERGLAGGAVLPRFLESWKSKILLAGKYLNVIRECGIEIVDRQAVVGEEPIALNEDSFYKRIDEAYTFANKKLLDLLRDDQNLISRLKTIKEYFFIDHGASFTHFLDLATYELSKHAKHVSVHKLQLLLDLALRSAAAGGGDEKDDLNVVIEKSSLTEWLLKVVTINGELGDGDSYGSGLIAAGRREAVENSTSSKNPKADPLTGFQALSLDFTVPFPISLVISRKTILRYQLLFRHLLQLKHLSRTLGITWTTHSKNPFWRNRSECPEIEKWKMRVWALRMKMLGYMDSLIAFCVGEALEPAWRKLEKKLAEVDTVDGLLTSHVDFLDTCLGQCLLTNERLLLLHARMISTCTMFVAYTSSFTKSVTQAEETATAAGGDWSTVDFTREWLYLNQFEENFNHNHKTNLSRISFHAGRENAALLPLVVRLTYLNVGELGGG